MYSLLEDFSSWLFCKLAFTIGSAWNLKRIIGRKFGIKIIKQRQQQQKKGSQTTYMHNTEIMALSKRIEVKGVKQAQGLKILNESPVHVYYVLEKLCECYNLCLCADVKMLQGEAQMKIEKCAVDFRHASIQTSSLAESLGSVWCRDCIIFFENIHGSGSDPCNVLKKIIPQTRLIGDWMRDVAGRFHECHELAKRDKRRYQKKVQDSLDECERDRNCASNLLSRRESELDDVKEEADKWRIAAMVPIVNIFAFPMALAKEGDVREARRKQERAENDASNARRALDRARSHMRKTEVGLLIHYISWNYAVVLCMVTGSSRTRW